MWSILGFTSIFGPYWDCIRIWYVAPILWFIRSLSFSEGPLRFRGDLDANGQRPLPGPAGESTLAEVEDWGTRAPHCTLHLPSSKARLEKSAYVRVALGGLGLGFYVRSSPVCQEKTSACACGVLDFVHMHTDTSMYV